jgi:hypothetical protein
MPSRLDEGEPRGVVDADMGELPAEPLATTAPVALAGPVAGMGALVTTDRLDGSKVAHPAQPRPPQNPAHRGRRDANLPGDGLPAQLLPAQRDDLLDPVVRRRAMKPMRSRRAIR